MVYKLESIEAIDKMLRDASVTVSDADLVGTFNVITTDIHAATSGGGIRLVTAEDGSGALYSYDRHDEFPAPDATPIAVIPLPAPIARAIAAALMTA